METKIILFLPFIILGVVKKIHYFCMKLNGKIMDFFLLHLIYKCIFPFAILRTTFSIYTSFGPYLFLIFKHSTHYKNFNVTTCRKSVSNDIILIAQIILVMIAFRCDNNNDENLKSVCDMWILLIELNNSQYIL